MKRVLKFLSVALAVVMVTSAAAPAVKSYAAREFTYAEQGTSTRVTELEMKPEEKVDLCFKGVSDYKKYTCTWISSNEDVATVDKKGEITAKAQGTTEIYLVLGDGTAYTSEPVVVSVISMSLTAGNASDKAMDVVELEKGKTLDLNFYGVTDWSKRKNVYLTEWLSSNEDVVTVDQSNGLVAAVEKGMSVVVFQIYDMERDILLSSAPVTIIVTE